MLAKYFSNDQKNKDYVEINQNDRSLNISITDGTKSNYTKKIYLSIVLKSSTIETYSDGSKNYEISDIPIRMFLEEVTILNESRSISQKSLKPQIKYSITYKDFDSLVFES